ncbi:hypothetical protein JCM16496A_12680 [Bacteroides rodentium JCM 16496]
MLHAHDLSAPVQLSVADTSASDAEVASNTFSTVPPEAVCLSPHTLMVVAVMVVVFKSPVVRVDFRTNGWSKVIAFSDTSGLPPSSSELEQPANNKAAAHSKLLLFIVIQLSF